MRLIDAIKGLQCRLHLVGEISRELLESLNEAGIEFTNTPAADTEAMYAIYKSADIVAMPSLNESFGMPIAEANATGRAVLTSDVSAMPEIAGHAACLINPLSISSIRDGIKKLIENEPYRRTLIENGFTNVKRFELAKIAKSHLDVYKEIVAG